jgi:glutamate-1-semialdehyde 2,1-aminomutase
VSIAVSQAFERRTGKSREIFERAKKVFPAGISYRIRSIEPYPFYVSCSSGSKVTDIDGNTYTDYWCGHFALILGHAPPDVVRAVIEQSERGLHYGIAHEMELRLAEQICKMVPSAQMLRFCGQEPMQTCSQLDSLGHTLEGQESVSLKGAGMVLMILCMLP